MRRGIVVGAVAVAMLTAVPMQAAVGAKPFRDPIRGGIGEGVNANAGSFTRFFPASKIDGCGFAEQVVVQVGGIFWQFSPGVEVEVNVATQTITNLASGTTYVHHSDYRRTITTLANGTQLYEIDGKFWISFVEGDQGPYGTVGPGGVEYFVSGNQTFVYDPRKNVTTSYSLTGQALNACQILA